MALRSKLFCLALLVSVLLMPGGAAIGGSTQSPANHILWIDLPANAKHYTTAAEVRALFEKIRQTPIDAVVVDVKAYTGYVGYSSRYAPHISETRIPSHRGLPPETDWLAMFSAAAREFGVRIYASMNVFSEGHRHLQDGALYLDPAKSAWRTVYFQEAFPEHTPPEAEALLGFTTFVNPLREDVRLHALAVAEEILAYDIDGLVLDRGRFANIFSDFSDETREAFTEFIGHSLQWPHDVYSLAVEGDDVTIEPGPFFQDWIQFRAASIADFFRSVRALVSQYDGKALGAYVGSWYNHYHHEGVNWARKGYQPSYDWAGPEYHETGYADMLDFIMVGAYYPEVTIEQAWEAGLEDWQSVEGGVELAVRVVDGAVPVYGSLYLLDYRYNPQTFLDALEMVNQWTEGAMLFDVIYLEQYDWWHLISEGQ